MVSSVVRHLDTCCGFSQKARTSPALCIAGSTAVAGLGWTARRQEVRPHSSSTFLSSVASSLCKRRILRTAWAGLLWMSFAAKRPSAGEGKEATPQRTLPGQGDFDTGDAPNPSRLPEISGARPPSLWHPPLDLAHRFTPQTDQKTDFAGFCPLLTSHSPKFIYLFASRASVIVPGVSRSLRHVPRNPPPLGFFFSQAEAAVGGGAPSKQRLF